MFFKLKMLKLIQTIIFNHKPQKLILPLNLIKYKKIICNFLRYYHAYYYIFSD